MKCSSIPVAQHIILSCQARKIKHIVISPGSRNAPLTIGFTENSFFECYSIVDERVAGFFALGLSIQQKTPVALVCTSGSALLNYYPAIAEAFYSNIPLVVISADRPPYKIDIGDGQTIRQKNVFHNHIGYAANLKLDVSHNLLKIKKYAPELLSETQDEIDAYNTKEIENCFSNATFNMQPVHMNVPFEEPLYETIDIDSFNEDKVNEVDLSEPTYDIADFARHWMVAKRKMILIGVNTPSMIEANVLEHLANDPSVLVFTETTSNVHHQNFFPSIDSILFPIEKSEKKEALFKELQPEILLTFGGMIVSKKIKAFLRCYKPNMHWHLGNHKFNDTYFALSHHIKSDPNAFLTSLIEETEPVGSNYFLKWNVVKLAYEEKRRKYLERIPFSDFWVFGNIIPRITDNFQVHLANSSTIRYSQLFDMNPSLEIFCNRGTSGIEGSTSTAIGAALHHTNSTVLITGDLSFFYDSNALWNSHIRKDFRILIINNSGGGIFRILPGKEASKNFETYFETRHTLTAKELCELYGFEYMKSSEKETFVPLLTSFFQNSYKPKVFEVFTPTEMNDKILLDYFDFIS
jgi:2-succinyl-5-enolpyruvyl-6-hydroxy-3-cyclohexene-1-carboxylate synthase